MSYKRILAKKRLNLRFLKSSANRCVNYGKEPVLIEVITGWAEGGMRQVDIERSAKVSGQELAARRNPIPFHPEGMDSGVTGSG